MSEPSPAPAMPLLCASCACAACAPCRPADRAHACTHPSLYLYSRADGVTVRWANGGTGAKDVNAKVCTMWEEADAEAKKPFEDQAAELKTTYVAVVCVLP